MAKTCSSSRSHFFFFIFVLITFDPFDLTFAQFTVDIDSPVWEIPPNGSCLSQQTNFIGSVFSDNLNRLVSSIPSLTSNTYGFYNISNGVDQDQVLAIGFCNRVVPKLDCLNCISQAAVYLTTEFCRGYREAYVRSTKCMFRYSDKPIFGKLETNPPLEAPNPNNASGDRNEFIRLQSELLNRLRIEAAAGGPLRKYAQGNGDASPPYRRFFASTQCRPDLSEKDCNDCLEYGFKNATKGRVGIRWFCPSCLFQIESDLIFYRLEYEPDMITKPGNEKWRIIVAIVVPVGSVIILASLCFILTRNRRTGIQRLEGSYKDGDNTDIADTQLSHLDFDTIKASTNNFSPENQLGEGGFGAVYKGVVGNGEEIAVKRLSMKSEQGDNEFINEIKLVAKLQHRNLVRLLGFCLKGEERLIIYEFFKNTSLDRFIFDSNRVKLVEWETRYRIISGVARGLLYLHEDSRFRIIHRDLKASNILLDDHMNPKIADFGMARLFETDQTSQIRFTSNIAGTYGYMAPEYAMKGQFSVKTDVYSFGVLLIEIITGKKNNWSPDDQTSRFLITYVWRNWREGRVKKIVDESLVEKSGGVISEEMMKCIDIGLLCVQEKEEKRPTMASVVVMLDTNSYTLPTPSNPAFYLHNNGESSLDQNPNATNTNSSAEAAVSLNFVTISDLDPR